MKLLAIDSCSKAGSVTICENGTVLAHGLLNTKLNHSQTLLPLVEHLLKQTQFRLEEIDLFALSKGPGSFTGVRIGMSVIKGFAFGSQKPCLAISTLESLAFLAIDFPGTIVPVLDARKDQFYTAAFDNQDGNMTRVKDDCVIDIAQIESFIQGLKKPVYLVGDGASLCYTKIENKAEVYLPSQLYQINSSWGVATAAINLFEQNPKLAVPANDLTPEYLRLSQAQVQLQEKQKKENASC